MPVKINQDEINDSGDLLILPNFRKFIINLLINLIISTFSKSNYAFFLKFFSCAKNNKN